ncbi:MAG: Rieske 2Fe-2S domain-containing protein [Vicinamibacteria bacterium]|nr:Rieske 2Fe-2S domain-containing protein [Vicinamibacteria bacterium]
MTRRVMTTPCARRRALQLLGAGAAGVSLGACQPPVPRVVRVPLSRLAGGQRVVVALGDDRIELSRSATGLVARSLVCTHQGCIVAWQEPEQHYKCPCQGGFFDALGRPTAGPVTAPLPLRPVRVEGDEAVVG